MKKLIIFIALVNNLLFATGPSYAIVNLTPIATHENGEVLFRTYRNINGMGGYGYEGVQLGWLVVSSAGVWDEQSSFIGHKSKLSDILKELEDYDKGKINWLKPDRVLKVFMKKYGFNKDTPLISEKFKRLELKNKQSCYMGKCIDRALLQRSVEGFTSSEILKSIKGHDYDTEGKIIKEPFLYKGVALFHNNFGDDAEEFGAKFKNLPPNYYMPGFDIGYELVDIDALVVFDPDTFR